MATKEEKKGGIWNWADRIQGDRVIWIIVLMLIMFSIVAIFSSTTQLAAQNGSTRLIIFKEQMRTVIIGLAIILICYFIPFIGLFRRLSSLGFLFSAGSLFMLLMRIKIGSFIRAVEINGAVRAISVFGLQFNVYEFVKVFMILYLSWAVNSYREGKTMLTDKLAKAFRSLSFLASPVSKRIIYIYLPFLIVLVCIMAGSFSSAMFIGAIMFLTIAIGGIPGKDILFTFTVALCAVAGSYGVYKVSGGKIFSRYETVESRFYNFTHPAEAKRETISIHGLKYYIDQERQPEGAKLAIKEGGVFGKLPGRSTRKYTVPLIFSDYMFSFIVEEYGLVGAFILIVLYVSLLARGAIIARNCDNLYAKMVVAGLVLLISGQAMMHMYINTGMWFLTGQTLPMISHGNSSFLAFSLAFGILLSISKMVKKKVERQAEMSAPLIEHEDEVRSTLDDLDRLESMNMDDFNGEE